jgi:MFS family permease
MQIAAATWFAYKLTDSAAAVGVLAVLAIGPSIVGGPLGGVLLDRFDPRRLAIALSLIAAVPPGLMAAMELAGDLSLGWLYALVFAGAIPRSMYEPVVSLIGPSTVAAEHRHSAVAHMSLSYNVVRLSGAAMGGLVVHWAGVWAAFGLNAVSFVIFAIILARTELVSDIVRRNEGSRAGLGEAVRQARAVSSVRIAALAVVAFFVFVAPVEYLMPIVAMEHGGSARSVGVLIAALGVGALLAYPIAAHRKNAGHRQQWLMSAGLVFGAAGMIALGTMPDHGIGLAPDHGIGDTPDHGIGDTDGHGIGADLPALMLIGFGWELVFVGAKSTISVEVSPEVRGRTMGLLFLVMSGCTALGAVGLGHLHDWLEMKWIFLGIAAVVLLAGGYLVSLVNSTPRTAIGEI